jgi:hypothetical protein
MYIFKEQAGYCYVYASVNTFQTEFLLREIQVKRCSLKLVWVSYSDYAQNVGLLRSEFHVWFQASEV